VADSPTSLQSLLSSIVHSSDDAIVSKDLRSVVTSWNPAAERMFGYTSSEMIGRSIRAIIPDDRQHEEDEVLARIRAGESVDHFETVRRRKDGTLVDISLSISPIRDESGTIVGASKIARDISERLRAQAEQERNRQQAIFLSRLSATFATSLEPKQILTSLANLSVPSFADWCAVDLRQPNGPIERLALVHVEPAKVQLISRLRERYENPQSSTSPTAVIRTGKAAIALNITDAMLVDVAKDDAERLRLLRSLNLVSYLCLPLKVHGRTIGAVTMAMAESGRHFDDDDVRIAEDAASRTALAIDNARAYEQLQAANQLKDEFLATLSHELRTPLNAILGYSRMLRAGILKEERKEQALETVERNATSLTQMVEDVLDVSRIAAGKIRLHVQPVDLAVVLRDALATVTPAAEAKGVRLESILEPHVGPVSGDPDRLQQVIWNLLSNAVKFTPRDGRVQLRLQRVNSHVEVSVSDTGIGIREDFLPHLFERFRQGDSTTTRIHGGLGLGLAIARRIVELHGGRIAALSPGEGRGATFRVELPAMIVHAEVDSSPRVHPHSEARGAAAEFPTLPDICVLVVDDDPDALGLVREILESAGARVRTATSARSALESIEESVPDVMVSDLGMPGMDGYELIQRIRQAEGPARELPTAALTAYARSEDRAKALRLGFEMHLSKPIDPSELIAAVASLARRRGVATR
jgi:PAS domain S-box-containing protein